MTESVLMTTTPPGVDDALRQRQQELASLGVMAAATSRATNLDVALRTLLDSLVATLRADGAGIYLLQQGQLTLHSHTGLPAGFGNLGEPDIAHLALLSSPQVLYHQADDSRRMLHPFWQAGFRSLASVPLRAAEGFFGLLLTASRWPGHFAAEQVGYLNTVGHLMATALQNERRLNARAQARELAETVERVSVAIGGSLNLDEVLQRILEQLQRLLPFDAANIMLIEQNQARMYAAQGYGALSETPPAPGQTLDILKIPSLRTIVQQVTSIVVTDAQSDTDWVPLPGGDRTRSWLGLPLEAKGRVIGVLALDSVTPHFYTEQHLRTAVAFAPHAAIAIENARLYREVTQWNERLEALVAERTRELKASERELRDRHRELATLYESVQASENRYRAIFETAPVAFLVLDDQGWVVDINRSGVAQLPWMGQSGPYHILHAPEAVASGLAAGYQRVMATGEPFVAADVALGHAAEGREEWANVGMVALRDKDGVVTGALAMIELTTERKRLEAQLMRSERLAAMGQLSASIAHEINNPLAVLKSTVQWIQRQTQKGAPVADELSDLNSEIDRLARLLRSLLDFARPSHEDFAEVDINRLIVSMTMLLKSQLDQRRIHLTLALEEGLPPLVASPDQLKQVLLNLVGNAQDAIPEAGGTIALTARRKGDYLILQVSDDGVGMSAEVQERLFEPFFSTKGVKGTGLGLSQVYSIVQRHGGKIRIESQPGQGTTVTLILPLTPPDRARGAV